MHVSFVFQNTCEHKWRLYGQPTTLKFSENMCGPTNKPKVQMSLPNKLEISLASRLRWLQLQQNGYAQRMGHTLISVVCRCLCNASRFLSTSFFLIVEALRGNSYESDHQEDSIDGDDAWVTPLSLLSAVAYVRPPGS
ncbi:hypothetical protein PVAP13_5NG486886 [Panicum virgatum]|uniref:Uncharacterized protein n=1 Tax=Panicum virgatum TaxID=38727 RepID=A0A8T0S3C4_PANVG|nr:hypothetical protein PVAP13_5NG486886 [Panicum virgatum]